VLVAVVGVVEPGVCGAFDGASLRHAPSASAATRATEAEVATFIGDIDVGRTARWRTLVRSLLGRRRAAQLSVPGATLLGRSTSRIEKICLPGRRARAPLSPPRQTVLRKYEARRRPDSDRAFDCCAFGEGSCTLALVRRARPRAKLNEPSLRSAMQRRG
jgi:hypothetical protein